jgi:tetratricopeptide (TPR) repeat protein
MNQRDFEDSTRSFVPISKGTMISHYKIIEKIGAGRLGDAVTMFEKAMRQYDESWTWSSAGGVKAYYWLGIAYEESGWNDKAIEQCEEFLDIWKDADPGIAEVEDARERLMRLKKES